MGWPTSAEAHAPLRWDSSRPPLTNGEAEAEVGSVSCPEPRACWWKGLDHTRSV